MPDPGRWSYVGVLACVLLGCLWLEFALRTRVLRRWRRLLLSMVLPVVVFTAWDAYAIASGHWHFDAGRVLGTEVVADVPIDEVLFFICIPLAAILTLEAVRAATGWDVGDEDVPDAADGTPVAGTASPIGGADAAADCDVVAGAAGEAAVADGAAVVDGAATGGAGPDRQGGRA